MTFEERVAQLRANTINGDSVNVSASDVYNELILQDLEVLANGTNSGVLLDSFGKLLLTNIDTNLPDILCKYVTLINSSKNNDVFYTLYGLGETLTLEPGYSVKINIGNTQDLSARQAAENGQTLQYIVTT